MFIFFCNVFFWYKKTPQAHTTVFITLQQETKNRQDTNMPYITFFVLDDGNQPKTRVKGISRQMMMGGGNNGKVCSIFFFFVFFCTVVPFVI